MRNKCKLHLCRRVRLPGRSKKWKIPVLKLKHAGQAQIMRQEECGLHGEVVEVSTFKEIAVDFFVAIGKLQRGSRRQPVGHPTLAATSGASHPTGKQVAIVGVSLPIAAKVPIDKPGG